MEDRRRQNCATENTEPCCWLLGEGLEATAEVAESCAMAQAHLQVKDNVKATTAWNT